MKVLAIIIKIITFRLKEVRTDKPRGLVTHIVQSDERYR